MVGQLLSIAVWIAKIKEQARGLNSASASSIWSLIRMCNHIFLMALMMWLWRPYSRFTVDNLGRWLAGFCSTSLSVEVASAQPLFS